MSLIDRLLPRRPIAEGSVVTGSDGTATISFPPTPSRPVVSLSVEGNYIVVVDSWVTDAAGNFVGLRIRALSIVLSTATGSAVTGLTRFTATVLSDVTPGTGTFVTGITKSTATVVSGVSTTTGSAVTGIPSVTGDAHGRYTRDSAGYLHHDHAIGSPSTATFVRGVSTSTTTVLSDVTPSTGSAVTGLTKSTATVLSDVVASTGSFLTSASLSLTPAANVRVHYMVW